MSDLATVSAEIAPYLAVAANSLGTSVLTAAQDRIAERTVTAGEGFFRRLLHRHDGAADLGDATDLGNGTTEPLLDVRRADTLDALLATLDDHDRRLLATAVTAWLRSPAEQREAEDFRHHVTRLASATGPQTVHYTPTATGQGSIAAVEIHGNITMGGSPRPQDDA
ncbi:hypothetical protein GCM10010211_36170 [Streptomyces albospinus]|uniref:Uncharacterized protein n=1 Tax=Streptomyces albospinus TaxID=285515 RepID=A0ABQ2V7L6_9ACTN|nr:hypothetical protein [Streptomyces albospinus]GGU67564.1 hypothetical protein GCM10010211_36170 [Streptomyces albospinus]